MRYPKVIIQVREPEGKHFHDYWVCNYTDTTDQHTALTAVLNKLLDGSDVEEFRVRLSNMREVRS